MNGLTAKQELFSSLVAAGKTQSDAHRQAYPSSLKWKPEAVHSVASTLAADPRVAQRIAELRDRAALRVGLQADKVLEEVRMLAHSDIGCILHADGRVKLPNELDLATRAAVKKFKIDELGRIEYEFYDKGQALDKAMRHLGLYEKDNTQASAGLAALRDALVGAVAGPSAGAELPDDDDA